MNIILDTDSYKFSHFNFYPPGTTEIYSYLESRGGEYDEIVVYGIEDFVLKINEGITYHDIREARDFAEKHGVPFNESGWQYIMTEYHGRLPVDIQGVPEGTVISPHNVIATIRNTDSNCAWLTSYLETALLRSVWYPSTVASRIRFMKKRIQEVFSKYSDNDVNPFSLLDFSLRGSSSLESAKQSGAAYLLFFQGSDNVPAVSWVNDVYSVEMSGFSLPATEHSVMTSWGLENELASFKHIIDNTPEGGTVSVVCDTWNVFDAAHKWGSLAKEITRRNIRLVFRPDSGDMYEVVSELLNILVQYFGYTTNSYGLKVLSNVNVLWGDGINQYTVTEPFMAAVDNGFAPDCILTGSGGGIAQANIDRDTCKFAFKASNAIVNGVLKPIAKNPVTDQGKRSKQGYLKLVRDNYGAFYTVTTCKDHTPPTSDYWVDYMDDYCPQWEEIVARANEGII